MPDPARTPANQTIDAMTSMLMGRLRCVARPHARHRRGAPRRASRRRAGKTGRPNLQPSAPAPDRPPSNARTAAATGSASYRAGIRRRAARAIPGCRTSSLKTPLQPFEAAPQPALDRADRHGETDRQLVAAQPVAIGEQHGAARLPFEFVEAALQSSEFDTAVG